METKGPTFPFSFLGLHQSKLSNNLIVYLCNVGALTSNDKMDLLHLCVRVGVGRVTIIMILWMGLRLQRYDFNKDILFNIMHSSLPFVILVRFVMFVVSKEIGKVQSNHQRNASPIGDFFTMFRILQLKLLIFSIIPTYLLFTIKTQLQC